MFIRIVMMALGLFVALASGPSYAQTSQALKDLRAGGVKAEDDCDASEDDAIKNARTKANNLQANQSGDQASNPMRACEDMKNAAREGKEALSSFKSRCKEANEKCKKGLEGIGERAVTGRDKEFKEACQKLNKDWDNLQSQIDRTESQANASQSCQQQIGGGQMPQLPQMPTKSPSPTPTPTVEKPKEDCSNPTFAATNPVCVCQANAFAVGCGTDQSPSVEAMINDSSQSVESGGGYSGSSPSAAPSNYDPSKLGRYQGQGGGGGGGVSAGGGPTNTGRDNPKADGLTQIPASGIGKGGGGGGGGGEGGGASRVAGGGYGEGEGFGKGRGPGSLRGDATGTDLKKFLPDGMTGPHTNLFHKVRVRYRANTSTLNP
ncbi:MAG: hypothetical protein KF767_10370 [Bdellovibrionaceae bacterium]|nr:hypothetical protein [Pseudobdellovibrionaceae bacterium]